MKTDLFQSCGHCWVFQNCWHIEPSTFTASSFRIWNSRISQKIFRKEKLSSSRIHCCYIIFTKECRKKVNPYRSLLHDYFMQFSQGRASWSRKGLWSLFYRRPNWGSGNLNCSASPIFLLVELGLSVKSFHSKFMPFPWHLRDVITQPSFIPICF